MCKCTPEIRTPFCGRGNCLPPGFANLSEWLGISDDEAEAAAQANLDRGWAQAVRQGQIATSEQATKLTAQEAQQLFAQLAALRTQLEQAQQAYFEEVIASAALREALAGIEKYADSFLNTHLDNYTLREISKQAARALSGEQG